MPLHVSSMKTVASWLVDRREKHDEKARIGVAPLLPLSQQTA
jgi:hypothetical protein